MYTVYGIPNCNTVKKAIDWLKSNHIAYEFHDYKKRGITEGELKKWCRQVGWETLLNKKGTTWRALDEAAQTAVLNEADAIALMKDKTSIIKRPVITKDNKILAMGFDEVVYKEVFNQQ